MGRKNASIRNDKAPLWSIRIYYIGGVFMFSMMKSSPSAKAKVTGNEMYPDIRGEVLFYDVHGGTLVVANIKNLLDSNGFHGFHIHE